MSFDEIRGHIKQGNTAKALKIVNEKIENSDSTNLKIDLLDLKFQCMIKLGLYEECILEVDLIDTIVSDPLLKATILLFKGSCCHHLGKLNDGMRIVDEIKLLMDQIQSHNIGYKHILANLFNLEGLLNLRNGNYDLAYYYLNRGLEIEEKVGSKTTLAKHYNSVGTFHFSRGEISESLEFLNKAYLIYEKHGDPQDKARLLNNLGEVHRLMGDFTQSVVYYEASHKLLETYGNPIQILGNLFNLIIVNTIAENWESAQRYFVKMQDKKPDMNNIVLNQLYQLSRGIILRQSKRISDLAEAEKIFRSIVYDKPVISNELTEIAMTNLANYYFMELIQNPDETTLNDFIKITTLIEQTSNKQKNWRLQALSFDLRAKILLINFEIEDASKLIIQAEILARERKLQSLAKRISLKSDLILEHFESLMDLQSAEMDLGSRIEILNSKQLTDTIESSVAVPDIQVPTEHPVIFMVLHAKSGVRITSYHFTDAEINEDLLAGLFSAIQSLTQSIFKSSGIIERLKYNEYTISFKILNNLLYSYVYTGPSYHVYQKFDNFILELDDFNWIKERSNESILKIDEEEIQDLNQVILETFK